MTKSKSRLKKVGAILGAVLLFAILAVAFINESRPEGQSGPGADQWATKMLAATNAAAWHQTGAVEWTFMGKNEHLWDRVNHQIQVKWGSYRVIRDLYSSRGRGWKDDRELSGADLAWALDKAYAHFVNDSFWLNPIPKLFDQGVSRGLVDLSKDDPGKQGLLMTFVSGGQTPGDAYLWHLDSDGLPSSWQMWVSILPLGGVSAHWSDWKTLSTGAMIARSHTLGPINISIDDVRGASGILQLTDGKNPLADLGRK
jgi:hypothetical protein